MHAYAEDGNLYGLQSIQAVEGGVLIVFMLL